VTFRSTIRSDICWGLNVAIIMAVVFSLLIVPIVMLDPDFSTHEGVSIIGLVAAYFGTAITSGLIAGFVRPKLRSWWGSGLLGMFVGYCFYIATSVLALRSHLSSADIIISQLCGLGGFGTGIAVWWRSSKSKT